MASSQTSQVLHVGSTDFSDKVLQADTPVIVEFWAEWCTYCRALTPHFERLSNAYQGKLQFAMLNADDHHEIPIQYGIQGLPTLLIFHKGKEVARLIGPHPTRLQSQIDNVLARI
ncbi:thioredoxin [Thermosporothrix hazakensis]|uniref:Thioredoxin n=1 Tax=Thermosporothrix hazakensis TaxID=644383 RepID=A0A326U5D7_THEHA|nr:thioredoxin domain-containing protein [Thermosporothrix hazakensis]PZW27904.1 thioredoxin [Thermosporothrix hazakensis]GCE51129.1 thioredoxin [Thermosporothrix hazakensis]